MSFRQFQTMSQTYLTTCRKCGSRTSKKYARAHSMLCKRCAEPQESTGPTREQRIIDHGYLAYAIEEGHYDHGDE